MLTPQMFKGDIDHCWHLLKHYKRPPHTSMNASLSFRCNMVIGNQWYVYMISGNFDVSCWLMAHLTFSTSDGVLLQNIGRTTTCSYLVLDFDYIIKPIMLPQSSTISCKVKGNLYLRYAHSGLEFTIPITLSTNNPS